MIIALKPKTIGEIKIARAEIAERIDEAAETLKRLPNKERRVLLCSRSHWPTMILQRWEHGAHEGIKLEKLNRPPPSGRQIDRCDEVMDWLLALAKQNRDFARAVWLCCGERRKPAEAAKVMGFHRETVRTYRDNGLDRIIEISARRSAAA